MLFKQDRQDLYNLFRLVTDFIQHLNIFLIIGLK